MSIHSHVSVLAMLVSLSGCGDGLSRGEAKKAIEEKLNKAKEFPTVSFDTGNRFFTPPTEPYALDSVCPLLVKTAEPLRGGFLPRNNPSGPWTDWEAARVAGFLVMHGKMFSYRDLGTPRTAIECTIQLTDKTKDYVVTEKDFWRGTIFKAVEGVEVTVTGITNPASEGEQTVSEVEYSTTYKMNPLGQALAGSKEAQEERTRRAIFQRFDDGWRMEN